MYIIRLKNCAFFAHHGVLDEEGALGQRFYLDAELSVDADQGLRGDDVGATVNYAEVFSEIEAIVTGSRRMLIETLALDVARAICARFPQIRSARITLRKPSAPVRAILDHVEVEVVWPADSR